MKKPRVLIVGATECTGNAIVNGLLDAGETEVEVLICPALMTELKPRGGVKIHVGQTKDGDMLAGILAGVDTVISAIGLGEGFDQIPLVDAAMKAGVNRFVPCAFMPICPPGGVMWIRDQNEQVYKHVRKLGLPYTIIDVGYWYQESFPTIPSGRVNYASVRVPNVTIFGDGNMKTALTDLRDIGRYVNKIINDDRTLNKYVFCYGELLSQEEIFMKLEVLSGEKIDRKYISADQVITLLESNKATFRTRPNDPSTEDRTKTIVLLENANSKFVRGDNSPKYAKYLGYLDARDLYPNFVPRMFDAFAVELLDGNAEEGVQMISWF